MNPPTDSAEVARLYKEFSASFSAHDDEAIRRIYRELLRLGRARAEIVDEAVRLASCNQSRLAKPSAQQPPARSNSIESFGIDRIAQLRAAKEPPSDMVSYGSGSALAITQSQKQEIGKGSMRLGLGSASERINEFGDDQVREDDDVSLPSRVSARGIDVLLPLPTARVSAAIGIVVFAFAVVLALSPARIAAEKAIRAEAPATATPSPSQNSVAPALPLSVLPSASASSENQRHELIESSWSAKKSDTKAGNHSTSNLTAAIDRSEQVEPGLTRSLAIAPRAAGSKKILNVPPLASRTTDVARQPSMVPTGQQAPDGAFPGVVDPPAASTVIAPEAAVKPLASNLDMAGLMRRGDSLFGTGDLVSARLFYERAANAGNGEAALKLGESYDPQFLAQAHLRGVRRDVAAAVFWYKRARDLGVREAEILIASLQVN